MPALSMTYGLRWADLETMPFGELESYLDHLSQMRKG